MPEASVWLYSLLSVFVVSLISLIGVLTLSVDQKKLHKYLIYLVSLSAGALLAGAFFHLLPELIEESGFTIQTSFFIILGILIFFALEKIIHWHHCHLPSGHSHAIRQSSSKKHAALSKKRKNKVERFAIMNLIGDGFHNFLDGLIIGASYLVALPAGIATTIAVALHEIPQEIGDFGVLLHGGFSKTKALAWNFTSALISIIGAVVALTLSRYVEDIHLFLVPLAIGGFIYIAGSDLIPELNKDFETKKSALQLLFLVLGILLMVMLLLIE